MKNYSEIIVIMDRSGSMWNLTDDTVGGFNQFVEDQKSVPGKARLTLILFNHEYKVMYENKKLNKIEPLTKAQYVATGTTALLDAVGKTITDVGIRLAALPENERPAKVITAIITDGYENASNEYTKVQIKDMIEHQQDNYSWEFMFLGANMDAFSEGASMAIPTSSIASYVADSKGLRGAYATMGNWTTASRINIQTQTTIRR